MKEVIKILTALTFLIVTLALLKGIRQVFSMEAKKDEIHMSHFVKAEKVDEKSEDDRDRNLNFGEKPFYEFESVCKQDIMKYENLVKSIDNYVQRYVSLFLITSNLGDYEVKDLSDTITIDLEISITGKDLVYLQGYSKSKPEYPKNFSKLDAVFYKIAKKKERTYLENALRQSHSFIENFIIFDTLNMLVISQYFRLLTAVLVTWVIFNFCSKKTLFFIVGGTLNSFLLWDSLNLYQKKVKEADAEIYVKTLLLKNAPEKCDPANIRWYDTFLNYFMENECLQYYKNLNKNAEEEVSLLHCIIDTYGYYLIQTPFKILGASIGDFTGEISKQWMWPFNHIVAVPLSAFFTVAIFILILLFYVKRIRLSMFGSAVEIGGGEPAVGTGKMPPLVTPTSIEDTRTVRAIRKLRPWTKSKFSKRMELDLVRRRRLSLKPSKSLLQITKEKEPDFSDNYTYCDSSLVKND